MRLLAQHGRFGNQLFRYAFLRIYAAQHQLQLQTAPWEGQRFFEIDDPPVTVYLPMRREPHHPWRESQTLPPSGEEFVNHDFFGYAQYHTSYYRPHRDFIRQVFRVRERYRAQLQTLTDSLRQGAETVIGLHIRRGDYGQAIFPKTPLVWFLAWLRQNWERWPRPRLFVATEDRSLLPAFAEYSPWVAPSSLADLPDYFLDFHLLRHCDVLAISASTFSFFAAMLNERLQELHRSRLAVQGFEKIDPWDSFPLPREAIARYPHLQKLVTTDADRLDLDTDVSCTDGHAPALS